MVLEKLTNLIRRVRRGEWSYYGKRLFPGGNMFLYGGVQLVFRLADLDKFEELYEIVDRRFHHQIRRASADDIERLCAEYPGSEQIFRIRVHRGNRCYIAVKSEEIVGFVWAAQPMGDHFDTNSLWVFRPDEMDGVWGTHGYVKPKYRLRGLFTFMMGAVLHDYVQEGYKRLYGETNGGNKASLQTHLSAGYEILWRVHYVSILGLKVYFAQNQKTEQWKIDYRFVLNVEKLRI